MLIDIGVYRVHAHDPKRAGCNGKLPVLFCSSLQLPRVHDTFIYETANWL
uniref:Uncharacterized protein n=1 Tax=Setaria italica TaxID=4555 RepID=K3YBP1_SETIT